MSHDNSLDNLLASIPARAGSQLANDLRNAKAEFDALHITSKAELLAKYSKLTAPAKSVSISLFEAADYTRSVPLLLSEMINRRQSFLRGRAAAAVARIGGETAMQTLLSMLKKPVARHRRHSIVYAISHFKRTRSPAKAIEALGVVLKSRRDSENIRGIAAEGVGLLLSEHRVSCKVYERAVASLVESLDDQAAEVRASAAFSLGRLREPAAIDKLRTIASSDQQECPGLGRVATIARSAIREIERRGRRRSGGTP